MKPAFAALRLASFLGPAVPGGRCKPKEAQPDAVILDTHGGWFHWGSAKAFRNLVGHLAIHAGEFAFSPDYRLAPSNPFRQLLRTFAPAMPASSMATKRSPSPATPQAAPLGCFSC
jgi:acetyl esterase/lipase